MVYLFVSYFAYFTLVLWCSILMITGVLFRHNYIIGKYYRAMWLCNIFAMAALFITAAIFHGAISSIIVDGQITLLGYSLIPINFVIAALLWACSFARSTCSKN